ncbi:MAG: pyridoxamine 5'-phosphate oxidase family protein [Ktedonobacteraceae bacterium]|nr:pyridoxamine 5'-phosphate oxidase family protein [Ktedonobacteraceae bacterium]
MRVAGGRGGPARCLPTIRHPYTVPVGFVWEGQTALIFSQPEKQKLRNIRKNPRVTLALDESNGGHDVVIIEGRQS